MSPATIDFTVMYFDGDECARTEIQTVPIDNQYHWSELKYLEPSPSHTLTPVDYYYYEYPTWESPYAVNYTPEQRLWFVSHGVRLHYVDDEQIEKLGLRKVNQFLGWEQYDMRNDNA